MSTKAWTTQTPSTSSILNDISTEESPVCIVSSSDEDQTSPIQNKGLETLTELKKEDVVTREDNVSDFSGVDDNTISSSPSDSMYDENNITESVSSTSRKSLRWSDHEGYDLAVVHYSDRLHYSVRDDDIYSQETTPCCNVS